MHRCTFRKPSRGSDMVGRCLTPLVQWICEFIFLFCCGIELIFVKSNSILKNKKSQLKVKTVTVTYT